MSMHGLPITYTEKKEKKVFRKPGESKIRGAPETKREKVTASAKSDGIKNSTGRNLNTLGAFWNSSIYTVPLKSSNFFRKRLNPARKLVKNS